MVAEEGEVDIFESDLRFENIKDLSMDYTNMDPSTITRWLRCFPSLETLQYVNGLSGYTDFEPPRIMSGLVHLQDCLQELTILDESTGGQSHLEGYPIGSFANFHKLRMLKVVSTMVTGSWGEVSRHSDGFAKNLVFANSLPPNLEVLTLICCENNVLLPVQISDLLAHKDRYPALRRIDMNWESIRFPDRSTPPELSVHPGFTLEEAEQVRAQSREVGVKIVVRVKAPEHKYVKHTEDGQPAGCWGTHVQYTKVFPYPYEGYEEFCQNCGCDPATGNFSMLLTLMTHR